MMLCVVVLKWWALLVASVIGTIFLFSYVGLGFVLDDRADEELRALPTDLAEQLCEQSGTGTVLVSPRIQFGALVATDGSTIRSCRGAVEPLELTVQDGARLAAKPDTGVEVVYRGQEFRALARPARTAGTMLVLGVSRAGDHATLVQLLGWMLVVGAVAVAVAVALSLVTLFVSVRPLDVEIQNRRVAEWRLRRLVANASHDLRSPLTSMQGYAELVRLRTARSGGETDAGTSDALARIESESRRMSRMVAQLVADSDGEPGQTLPVAVQLDVLAGDAVAALRVAHPYRSVELYVTGLCLIMGDSDRLRQVIDNLIGNAVVHTRAGGPVAIRLHRVADTVRLHIDDAGPGLTPDQLTRAFDRFWRAEPTRPGSGLGLSIVHEIVTEHGGAVDVESSPLSGTTVTVILPAA